MTYLYMDRGNDRAFQIDATIDLTGADARWVARRTRDDSGPIVLQKTEDDGLAIAVGTEGLATLTIDRADTVNFERDTRLFWDLQITKDGDTRTVISGRLYVRAGVVTIAP